MSYHPYVPEDFDAFWAGVVAEAKAEPLDFHRSLRPDWESPTHRVERIEFRGIQGHTLYGWLAFPHGGRRLPGFVWLPPYGLESRVPDEYGTREGMVSLSFNFHGRPAFHQEDYHQSRGYFALGSEEPETWIFKTMFQNAYLAARVLQAQIEVDEDRCAAAGMSQGGGMAIWLGAHCPIVRTVCADMPFLCGMNHVLAHHVYRYPLKELVDYGETIPLGLERIRHTVSYFDTLNQATRCKAPTLVGLGLKDPAAKPRGVESAFDALAGPKTLIKYEIGHDWHPDMVANNRNWMLGNL
ncbi:MAG: acetylxylan esterase [Armatimonadetes bacterium]|nr:acetylxylan esterase [Armatimonadota bacterium]